MMQTSHETSRATRQPPRRRRAQRGSGEQLRDEIIAATKQLLSGAKSTDDVSIRQVAQAVGVTAPSIYLHFADKDDLIAAVVIDVFGELDKAMLAAGGGENSPMGRLRAYGRAYVEFAVTHPEHYRFAAMEPCVEPTNAVDEVLASSAFAHFNQTVIDCIEAGVFVDADPLPVTFDLWAAAHGAASLLIAKPYLPFGDVAAFTDRVLCAAALGHAASSLLDDLEPGTITAWVRKQHDAQHEGSGAHATT
jgi:AcrR family transcriptional regulator